MMLDIFQQFATDENLENKGVWIPYNGAKFLIARSGTKNYTKVITEKVDANRLLLDIGDEAAEELNKKLLIEAIAETILLGWENVAYQGEPLTYKNDAERLAGAKKLLQHRDFRVLVQSWSENFTNFRVKQAEELAGK